ncbi:hypothetical protein ILUMI_19778, partial [Ignelater luminosus]
KTTNWAPISIGAILSLAIFVLLTPITFFSFFLFAVYRQLVWVLLKIKHGKDFYGLLNGADAFHVVGKAENVLTISCFMVRCEKYTSEEFYETFKQMMSKANAIEKFKTLVCKSFGYPYLIKQKLDIGKDCVAKMKILECPEKKIDKRQLHELLNYHCNVPMPRNGKIPCHVLIGTQPVNWKDDDYNYYPVMFKVHHGVSDGISLLKAFVALTGDKLEVDKETINLSKPTKKEKYNSFGNILAVINTLLLVTFLHPSLIVNYFTYKAKDFNILHNTSLTEQKLIGIGSEENGKYVEKIKKIKQNLPGTAFPTILMTAFSASLSEYFIKKSLPPPKYITLAIPINVRALDLRYLTPKDVNIDDISLANSYSLILMKIPIAIEDGDESILPANKQVINRLRLINKEVQMLSNSPEYQINHFFMQVICAVLPQYFIKLILSTMHCTTIASILSAPPKMMLCNQQLVITDIIAWIAHVHPTGTSIGIITYDDRLHVGVNVDEAFISDRADVQAIADNIYKYLDVLERE